MIEMKLSQGAKPGHGGVLPGRQGDARDRRRARRAGRRRLHLAGARTAPSPRRSRLLQFVERLRELSGGKPTGFKLCIGHPWEWFAHRARRCWRPASRPTSSSSTAPRAAPARRRSSSPTTSARRCRKGCCWCTTRWSGSNLRERIRIGCAGKVVTRLRHRAHHGARRRLVQRRARLHVRARLHPGADLPHRPLPDRRDDAGPAAPAALVVPDKAERVYQLPPEHAAGAEGAGAGRRAEAPEPDHAPRTSCAALDDHDVRLLANLLPFVKPGELLAAIAATPTGRTTVFELTGRWRAATAFSPRAATALGPRAATALRPRRATAFSRRRAERSGRARRACR